MSNAIQTLLEKLSQIKKKCVLQLLVLAEVHPFLFCEESASYNRDANTITVVTLTDVIPCDQPVPNPMAELCDRQQCASQNECEMLCAKAAKTARY